MGWVVAEWWLDASRASHSLARRPAGPPAGPPAHWQTDRPQRSATNLNHLHPNPAEPKTNQTPPQRNPKPQTPPLTPPKPPEPKTNQAHPMEPRTLKPPHPAGPQPHPAPEKAPPQKGSPPGSPDAATRPQP
ncbi:hypothetical protein GCM10029964_076860 [Kibdelosporangium lantanae]